MILIPCTHCGLVLRVIGDPGQVEALVGEKSEFHANGYSCAACGAKTTAIREVEADAGALSRMQLVDTSPPEAYAALHGLGLPSERSCTPEVLQHLLLAHRIARVRVRKLEGVERCCLDELELADGTRLYLGSSAEGAVVYRVVSRTSYAGRAENG